jgi:hypothetical protein
VPLISLSRPGVIVRNVIDELRRYTKHDAENLERVNGKFFQVSQTFVHGTATEIVNPWYPSLPTGFMVTSAADSDGNPITAPAVSFTAFARDGWSSLTVNFAPPNTRTTVTVATGAAVALATGVGSAVASISPAVGIYDVEGVVMINAGPTGLSLVRGAIQNISATSIGGLGSNSVENSPASSPATTPIGRVAVTLPPQRYEVTAAAPTIWMTARADFTGGTTSGLGWLTAVSVAPPTGYTATVTGYLLGP